MMLAMKRILGIEKKNRIRTNIMIENEFKEIMDDRRIIYSDLINVLLEKELVEKKRL